MISRHTQAGVIKIGDIGLVGAGHSLLFDQSCARIKRVGQAAVEDPHGEAIEINFHSIANGTRFRCAQLKTAREAACALRMTGREIKELIPAAAPDTGVGPVERTRALDHWLAFDTDGSDQRARGIKRELGAPHTRSFVWPAHNQRVHLGFDGDGTRAQTGDIHRHRGRPAGERQEKHAKAHGAILQETQGGSRFRVSGAGFRVQSRQCPWW